MAMKDSDKLVFDLIGLNARITSAQVHLDDAEYQPTPAKKAKVKYWRAQLERRKQDLATFNAEHSK